jgi:hypothetical protein
MQMHTSARSEVLREAEQDKGRRGDPRVADLPQEGCASQQAPPRNPVGSHVPDKGAFQTFVGGDGI